MRCDNNNKKAQEFLYKRIRELLTEGLSTKVIKQRLNCTETPIYRIRKRMEEEVGKC